MPQPEIKKFESVTALNRSAAETFVLRAWQAKRDRGRFDVALSGGSTPRMLYELLAESEFSNRIDWQCVHVFWGDERCVPPDSPDSNYRMANEALLSKVPIPTENVHRFQTELGDPKIIARKMELEMRASFHILGNPAADAERFPRFDLVFLGLGTDGHTASLFPDTSALKETKRIVVENYVPKFSGYRLTFTYPTINNARDVVFLVSGEEKSRITDEILNGSYNAERLPAQGIRPTDGNLTFLITP